MIAKSSIHFFLIAIALLALVAVSGTLLAATPQLLKPAAPTCTCMDGQASTAWVWPAAGAALLIMMRLAVAFAQTWRRTRRFLQAALPRRKPLADTGLDVAVDVIPDSAAVFCHGLLKPRIAVGQQILETLDETQLRAVLSHEASHARRRDPLRLFVVSAVATVFGRYGRRLEEAFSLNLECDADQAAVTEHGQPALAHAFMQLLTLPAMVVPVPSLSVTEFRIRRLLGEQARPRIRSVVIGVMIVSLLAVLGIRATVRASQLAAEPTPSGMCVRQAVCSAPANERHVCFQTTRGLWCAHETVVEPFTRLH